MSHRLTVALSHTIRVLLLVATTCVAVFAQGVTGTLSGTVKDPQGAVVPGATVTVINEAQGTKMAPVIDQCHRRFRRAQLPADTYTVQVEMPSFRHAEAWRHQRECRTASGPRRR